MVQTVLALFAASSVTATCCGKLSGAKERETGPSVNFNTLHDCVFLWDPISLKGFLLFLDFSHEQLPNFAFFKVVLQRWKP